MVLRMSDVKHTADLIRPLEDCHHPQSKIVSQLPDLVHPRPGGGGGGGTNIWKG